MANQPVDRLDEFVRRLTGDFRDAMLELIDETDLGAAFEVDPDRAQAMVTPYTWLLDRSAGEGVPLTKAGYLPPAVVSEAASALHLDREWIGKLNREEHTYPLYEFRQGARSLGLVRVHRGRLVNTRLGASLRDDPDELWWHIAGRLPLAGREAGYDAGVVRLLIAAAQSAEVHTTLVEIIPMMAIGLVACGWKITGSDRWLLEREVAELVRNTETVLRRLRAVNVAHAMRGNELSVRESEAGATFARAALLTWQ